MLVFSDWCLGQESPLSFLGKQRYTLLLDEFQRVHCQRKDQKRLSKSISRSCNMRQKTSPDVANGVTSYLETHEQKHKYPRQSPVESHPTERSAQDCPTRVSTFMQCPISGLTSWMLRRKRISGSEDVNCKYVPPDSQACFIRMLSHTRLR